MKIIDLTGQYIEHFINNQDQQSYENSHPKLFEHYYKFTNNERKIQTLPINDVTTRLKTVKNELDYIEDKFDDYGLEITHLKLILFVGIGITNGHAYRDNNEFIVWIPIETYTSSILARVFITHEIIHALHYIKQPGFYFDNLDEMRVTSRQLITEGLATLLTREVLGVDDISALWADFLDNDTARRWIGDCQSRETEICEFLKNSYDKYNPDIQLFYASDPNNILAFRAGYYIGMKLLDEIINENDITARALIDIPRDEFEKLVLKKLSDR